MAVERVERTTKMAERAGREGDNIMRQQKNKVIEHFKALSCVSGQELLAHSINTRTHILINRRGRIIHIVKIITIPYDAGTNRC